LSNPFVVIDTNVVLDLLHFDDATARPLRLALEAGRVRCAVTEATLGELRRVLAYPEFGLDEARQAELFARYQALAVAAAAGLRCPDCRVAATPTTRSSSSWPPLFKRRRWSARIARC
jgi:uncharacterized protein